MSCARSESVCLLSTSANTHHMCWTGHFPLARARPRFFGRTEYVRQHTPCVLIGTFCVCSGHMSCPHAVLLSAGRVGHTGPMLTPQYNIRHPTVRHPTVHCMRMSRWRVFPKSPRCVFVCVCVCLCVCVFVCCFVLVSAARCHDKLEADRAYDHNDQQRKSHG